MGAGTTGIILTSELGIITLFYDRLDNLKGDFVMTHICMIRRIVPEGMED